MVQSELFPFIKQVKNNNLKVAWYAGLTHVNNKELLDSLDYYKIGPWQEKNGPLNKKTTNQRFYKNVNGEHKDITYMFWKEK